MLKPKHVVIVAGEESGDMHAAELIQSLKSKYPDIKFSGVGGRHMQSAGAELIYDLASYGVTGLTEVVRQFKFIKSAFTAIKAHLEEHKPDLLILVDYPGFNLRLAKFAKRELGLKILYYISPQIWAWKANRIHLIRECIDKMAVIFPFEKVLYEKAGVPVSFVGHPLVKKINPETMACLNKEQLGLPAHKKIIALLPGSRKHEISHHMPEFKKTMHLAQQRFEDLHFVIPVAGTITNDTINKYLTEFDKSCYTLINGHSIDVAACSDFIIVASGTASLECALLEKPMCIIYKASYLSYLVGSKVIKTKYLGLCNILSNQMLVPELLQYDFKAEALLELIERYLMDAKAISNMHQNLHDLRLNLSSNNADYSLNELIEYELQLNP